MFRMALWFDFACVGVCGDGRVWRGRVEKGGQEFEAKEMLS